MANSKGQFQQLKDGSLIGDGYVPVITKAEQHVDISQIEVLQVLHWAIHNRTTLAQDATTKD